ncbi:unnamed protein product [Amoebophrya sp. A120]|nr:unnamed protein product [Amoebophrya sp. A120]|eukprot:GSA120T00014258001.1
MPGRPRPCFDRAERPPVVPGRGASVSFGFLCRAGTQRPARCTAAGLFLCESVECVGAQAPPSPAPCKAGGGFGGRFVAAPCLCQRAGVYGVARLAYCKRPSAPPERPAWVRGCPEVT